jgi:hypothetical protein
MKKLLITLTAIVSAIVSFAEQTKPIQKTFKQDPFNHPDFPEFIVTYFAGVVLVLLISVGIYIARVTRFLRAQLNPKQHMPVIPLTIATQESTYKKWSLYGSLGLVAIVVIILTLTGFIHV